MKSTALLIDGNALIHRAWHALPPLTAPDGSVINAVYGFTTVLQKILASERPDYLVVCWDTPEPTYRHTAEPAYKAQREDQAPEFYEQFPKTQEVVAAFGGHNVELPGYEADDLLATIAMRLAAKEVDVTVLTSDRDAWQMIRPGIRVMSFVKGVTETLIYDQGSFFGLTGLHPSQVVAWKALAGDSSDNLKGVPGIGDKTALELLRDYHDLDGIFAAAHDVASPLKPGVRQKLLAGEQAGRETLKLVTLMTDAPIAVSDEDLRRHRVDEGALRTVLMRFGFKTLVSKLFGNQTSSEVVRTTKSSASPQAEQLMTSLLQSPDEVLRAAQKEKILFVHPVVVTQESLFSDAPVLLLGSTSVHAILTRTQLEQTAVRDLLTSVCEDPEIKKIGHDLKLFWHWCSARGFFVNGIAFDTEIAAYLLSAGERTYDLATLSLKYLDRVVTEEDLQTPALLDVLRALYASLRRALEDARLEHILARFELPLIPVLGAMEREGILIDRAYFQQLHDAFLSVKTALEADMVALAGESFNPASPSQLAHILFDVLHVSTKGIKRGKTGISTAASELEKLEGAHPIIAKVGEFREVAKLLSTYVDALPQLADAHGRVHTTFNQTVAATGRLSSTEPNLQNIPIRTELGRQIRRGFIARPGYTLVSCDYSQIELRVIAALAKDEKMLAAFTHGHDIHTATAAAMWNLALTDVTKDQRRAAKAINFGIIYGQGPQGLSKAAGVSFEEARHFIAEYFSVYSGIREYLDQTKAIAHAQGYIETLFGRRRAMTDINSPLPQLRSAAERMAINMPVQGTAADLMKLGMLAVARELPGISSTARILLQVHDELVLEVPDQDVSLVAKRVVDLMEHCEKIGVPIVVEAKAGKNWEEMSRISS